MRNLVIAWVALFAGSQASFAQGTISDGTATFSRNNFAIRSNNIDYRVGAGPDQAYEDAWYFRVVGDPDETLLATPDTQNYSGSVSTLTWSDVGGRGLFDAELTTTVFESDGGTTSIIQHDLALTNIGSESFDIHVFGYLDYDLINDIINEAELVNDPDLIRVTNENTFGEFHGVGAVEFQATSTFSFQSLRDLMVDGQPTQLDGSGLPFGPDDWEGAFQWNATIAPASSETFTKIYTIDREIESSSIFADGFESGDTSAWSSSS